MSGFTWPTTGTPFLPGQIDASMLNFGEAVDGSTPGAPVWTPPAVNAPGVAGLATAATNPAAGAPTTLWGKMGGFEGLGSLAKGLASLGQIWGAMQGVKLARDQMDFSKDVYKTNLANTRMDYNTQLEDRIRSRYATEGRSASEADSYLSTHKI